jgi:hypothetical protein
MMGMASDAKPDDLAPASAGVDCVFIASRQQKINDHQLL